MKKNNFYITTPIYYPSGEPHMGHAYSSIIADVLARFMRNDNNNVFFLTGTDEHGLKIQKAAEKNNSDPLSYCDKISQIFKDLTKKLNLSNDDFIRTTEKRHHKAVIEIWNRLVDSKDIYIEISNKGQRKYKVELVGICPEFDIALLKSVEYKSKEYFQIGDSDKEYTGIEVVAIGFPLGQNNIKITRGIVSAISGLGNNYSR